MATYYNGNLQKDLALIGDNECKDELDIIGKKIGYGRAQQILQVLWAQKLKEDGFPTSGALGVADRPRDEDYIKTLNKKISEIKPVVMAVAHIGVDFGFGPSTIDDDTIKKARELAQIIYEIGG